MIETNWNTSTVDIKLDLLRAVDRMNEAKRDSDKLYTYIYLTQAAWDHIKPHVVKPEATQFGIMLFGIPVKVFPTIVQLIAEPQTENENVLAVDFSVDRLVKINLAGIRAITLSYSLQDGPLPWQQQKQSDHQ